MNTTNEHQVRVLRYVATDRPFVQGFCDLEIDGAWRLNGLNVMRDGSVRPGQLTPLVGGRRVHIDSIQILDRGLRQTLTAAVLAAIQAHLETLPPEQRSKPPRPPEQQKPGDRPGDRPVNMPVNGKPARTILPAVPMKPRPQVAGPKPPAAKPALSPPPRLLANLRRLP